MIDADTAALANGTQTAPSFTPEDFSPWLIGSARGYNAYRMAVDADNAHLAARVREVHKTHLHNNGYRGYDDDIDAPYHREGVYCFISKDDRIVHGARVNTRAAGAFPFEFGELDGGRRHRANRLEHEADVNTYSMDPRHYRHTIALFSAVLGAHLHQYGYRRAWCLMDDSNRVIERVYRSGGWRRSSRFGDPVSFPGFTHIERPGPVWWTVMELDAETIAEHARAAHRSELQDGLVAAA